MGKLTVVCVVMAMAMAAAAAGAQSSDTTINPLEALACPLLRIDVATSAITRDDGAQFARLRVVPLSASAHTPAAISLHTVRFVDAHCVVGASHYDVRMAPIEAAFLADLPRNAEQPATCSFTYEVALGLATAPAADEYTMQCDSASFALPGAPAAAAGVEQLDEGVTEKTQEQQLTQTPIQQQVTKQQQQQEYVKAPIQQQVKQQEYVKAPIQQQVTKQQEYVKAPIQQQQQVQQQVTQEQHITKAPIQQQVKQQEYVKAPIQQQVQQQVTQEQHIAKAPIQQQATKQQEYVKAPIQQQVKQEQHLGQAHMLMVDDQGVFGGTEASADAVSSGVSITCPALDFAHEARVLTDRLFHISFTGVGPAAGAAGLALSEVPLVLVLFAARGADGALLSEYTQMPLARVSAVQHEAILPLPVSAAGATTQLQGQQVAAGLEYFFQYTAVFGGGKGAVQQQGGAVSAASGVKIQCDTQHYALADTTPRTHITELQLPRSVSNEFLAATDTVTANGHIMCPIINFHLAALPNERRVVATAVTAASVHDQLQSIDYAILHYRPGLSGDAVNDRMTALSAKVFADAITDVPHNEAISYWVTYQAVLNNERLECNTNLQYAIF